MKRFYARTSALVALFASVAVQAADFNVEPFYFNIISEADATCALAQPASGKYAGDVDVPGHVEYAGKTWTVTEVGSKAFYSSRDVITITLPNTVKSLRRGCIDMCNSLTALKLPESLEYIDTMAISTCNALTELKLPAGLKRIAYRGISLSKMPSISIPASVTVIEPQAFFKSSLLATIEVDKDNPVYTAADGMLMLKDKSCVVMNMPGNLLTELGLPATVTKIEAWAFHNTSSLKTIIVPDHVTEIGEWAFGECRNAAEINTGNGLKYIPAFGFGWANCCEKLTIGKNVTSIARNAFESCGSRVSKTIQPLKIGANVKHIGTEAFTGSAFNTIELAEGIETVDTLAFSGMSYLATVNLPGSMKEIKMLGFQSAPKLTSITFPAALTTIGDGAFAGCTKLADVKITDGITNIGKRAFSKCTSLTAINVADGNKHFASVDGVVYTKDLSMLKQYPAGCADTLFVLPANVVAVEGGALAGASKLRAVKFHDDVQSMGVGVLQECSSLTQVVLPQTLTVLPDATFMSCSRLKNVTLPEGLKAIGTEAFYACQSLQSIELPETLETLGNMAFEMQRYYSLKSVYSRNPVPPACTYNGYSYLATFNGSILSQGTLYVPKGTIDAYRNAPGWGQFKNIVEDATSGAEIAEIDEACSINVSAGNGAITIQAPEGTAVSIYAINGACVWQGVAPAYVDHLDKGIYIVRAGTSVYKVRI